MTVEETPLKKTAKAASALQSFIDSQVKERPSLRKDSTLARVEEHSSTYGGTSLHMSAKKQYGNVNLQTPVPGTVAGAVAFSI